MNATNLTFGENAEIVSLHFTLELEGLRHQANFEWMKNLDGGPTWHPMDIVSKSIGFCVNAHLKEVGLTQNQVTMRLQNLIIFDLLQLIIEWKS